MESGNDLIKLLKEDMDYIRAENPHIGALIDAFGPVILTEHVLQEKIADKIVALSPDKLKVMGGVPLIKEHLLFFPDDPWKEFALSVTAAIREGFPHIEKDIDQLTAFFQRNPQKIKDLFMSSEMLTGNDLPSWIADIQVQTSVLLLLINTIKRIILTAWAKSSAEKIAAIPWDKGYCPICGSFPMLAFLRINGQRWLHCACCHHEWTYPRPKCPWCEHETPEETTYLFVEGDKDNSAFICEACRKYLITVNRTEGIKEIHSDLTAISLAHLDVIMQGKGFMPMAECGWNIFQEEPQLEISKGIQ